MYPSKDSVGFVGYGDADPSNRSLLVRGAAMRIAETRDAILQRRPLWKMLESHSLSARDNPVEAASTIRLQFQQ